MPENIVILRMFSMNMVGRLFSIVATLVSKLTLAVSELLAIILFVDAPFVQKQLFEENRCMIQ